MNIVIPMAGLGKRFADAGYDKPKPLIDVLGRPMIAQVIWNITTVMPEMRMIFIINGSSDSRELEKVIFESVYKPTIIKTPGLTDGSARTVLLAKELIDNDDELVVTNCDQITEDLDLSILSEFARINEADGVLGSFISTSPKNSYMLLDDNGCVQRVKEKIVISNLATNGLHYWRKGSDFVESATKMIEANERYNNEFYVAPSYNYMIKDGKKVLPFFYNMHYPIGTPEDLKKYEDLQTR